MLRLRLRRRRLLSLAAAAAAGSLLGLPWTARAAGEPVRVVLPNGLIVIAEERPSADTVALYLAARVGARDDGDLAGIAAFTSQALYHVPAGDNPTRFGGAASRGLSLELGWYATVVPTRETDIAFGLLSDILLAPVLPAVELEQTKGVRLQSLAERRTNPSVLLGDSLSVSLFAGHPLGALVAGTEAGIAAISRGDVLAHRERFWRASNLVLAVAGRIHVEDAQAKARQFLGELASGSLNQRQPVTPVGPDGARALRIEVAAQQALFQLGFLAPPLGDADQYPMTVLNGLMSGPAGRIFRELRTRRGLAYSAGSTYSAFSDAGVWSVGAGVDPLNVDLAVDLVRAEVQRLRDELPSEKDVADRISQFAGSLLVATETNAAVAGLLAAEEILGDVSAEEFNRRISLVTPADVQRVAQRYLDPDRALLVVVGPPGG